MYVCMYIKQVKQLTIHWNFSTCVNLKKTALSAKVKLKILERILSVILFIHVLVLCQYSEK